MVCVAAALACTGQLTPRIFCGPNLPPCNQPLVCTNPDSGGVCVVDTWKGDAGLDAGTDAGLDAGDAGLDAGTDAGPDAGDGGTTDAGLLSISNFSPTRGSSKSFVTLVTVWGTGFDSGVTLQFGETPGTSITVWNDTALQVTAPALPRGPVNIVVTSQSLDASAIGPFPFTYYDPVSASAISPDAGRATGGETVTIYGSGFVPDDAGVWFGSNLGTIVSIDPDGGSLQALTPAGLAYDPVDVVISNHNGFATLPLAFDYYSILSTIAGGGGGTDTEARLVHLGDTTFAAISTGGDIYVSSADLHRIYIIYPNGRLTHIAGTGVYDSGADGLALTTDIASPRTVAVTADGTVYFAEYGGNRVRKIVAGGIVTVAGNGVAASNGDNGLATSASVLTPFGVALDTAGRLFITEQLAHIVRRVDLDGVIRVVAGTRQVGFDAGASLGEYTRIAFPSGIVEWPVGTGGVAFAEYGNGIVRHVDRDGGTRILAGGGSTTFDSGIAATAALLPETLCVSRGASGTLLVSQYAASWASNRSRVLSYVEDAGIDGGALYAVAGTGNPGLSNDGVLATSNPIWAPCVFSNSAGQPFFTDYSTSGSRIRTIDSGALLTVGGSGNEATNFFGDLGPATSAGIGGAISVAFDRTSNRLFIGDTRNHRIRVVETDGVIWTFAGNGDAGFTGENGEAVIASLFQPRGIIADSSGTIHFSDNRNNRLRSIVQANPPPIIQLLAGDGTTDNPSDYSDTPTAKLNAPRGLAITADGTIYVADYGNHVVRRITPDRLFISRFAGQFDKPTDAGVPLGDDGGALFATLSGPTDVAVDSQGNVYIADSNNHRIRRVRDGGEIIETVIGTGVAATSGDFGPAALASLNNPTGICVDEKDRLYIAERNGFVVRRVWKNTQGIEIVRVIAGRADAGLFNGDGWPSTVGTLTDPNDVECGPNGTLYVTEPAIDRVRIIK